MVERVWLNKEGKKEKDYGTGLQAIKVGIAWSKDRRVKRNFMRWLSFGEDTRFESWLREFCMNLKVDSERVMNDLKETTLEGGCKC
ncbi:MAG: hypothetical protein ACE5HW_05825 [Candidatus Methanofastidiosia archaeon]